MTIRRLSVVSIAAEAAGIKTFAVLNEIASVLQATDLVYDTEVELVSAIGDHLWSARESLAEADPNILRFEVHNFDDDGIDVKRRVMVKAITPGGLEHLGKIELAEEIPAVYTAAPELDVFYSVGVVDLHVADEVHDNTALLPKTILGPEEFANIRATYGCEIGQCIMKLPRSNVLVDTITIKAAIGTTGLFVKRRYIRS